MSDILIKQLLLSNAYWVLNKSIVKYIGLEPAFLLGVFAEAEKELADDDGWFYQTSTKIMELTGLSNHKQSNAIGKLIELGVLMQENRGVPCKRYFKISYENIENLVFKNFENWNLKNSKTSFEKISNNKESNNIKKIENKETNDKDTFGVKPKKPKKKEAALVDPNKKQYGEFVTLTDKEYQQLIAKLGNEEAAKECIEILDNAKGAKGYIYRSDYRAILSWVIDRYKEKHQQKPAFGNQQSIVEKAKQMIGNADMTMPSEEEEAEAIRRFHTTGGYI